MAPIDVDYSLYLVTDSGLVPEGSTVAKHVQAAVANGTTLVQLREKHADTRQFIEIAKEVHAITQSAGVPLIINDRVDVAIAIGAEGVHVGQDDMDLKSVRRFLNDPNKIVGVSVHDPAELETAIKDGADYVGIGAVFGTTTKDLKQNPIGVYGLKKLLIENRNRVQTVAIGGINQSNVQRVLYSSCPPNPEWRLSGVAVVSCIMAAEDPAEASKSMASLIHSRPPWVADNLTPLSDAHFGYKKDKSSSTDSRPLSTSAHVNSLLAVEDEKIVNLASLIFTQVAKTRPLLHHITNNVVKNFSANISLAAGASPAMSESTDEFADFASVPTAALLINMGMPSPEGVKMYKAAISEYNKVGRPVVFDPVGAGASKLRISACKTLLETSVFNVVKGNEGEIYSASGVTPDDKDANKIQGVDSIGVSSLESRIKAARTLATDYHTTVVMTGPQDVIADSTGSLLFTCNNGHEFMGEITGSGCSLGSLISACLVASRVVLKDLKSDFDPDFLGAVTAVLVYTIAGERAAESTSCRGPGTFIPAFVDEIYAISKECQANDFKWTSGAKVTFKGQNDQ